MSTPMNTSGDPGFQPAFCHRNDCGAEADKAFCSVCGADIAAYLDATSPVAPIAVVPPSDEHVTHEMASLPVVQIAGAGTAAEAEETTAAPGWRQPLVLLAFGAASAAGAVGGVLAGLA
jgi:hypothetical protein